MTQRRIKIGQLVYDFHLEGGGGGISRCVFDIAQNLDPALFQVGIYALGFHGTAAEKKWIEKLNSRGIYTFSSIDWDNTHPYQSFVDAFKILDKEFRARPVDILHSHSEFSDIFLTLYKIKNKKTCILRTVHYGFKQEWKKKPWRRALLTNLLYPIVFDCETGVNPSISNRLSNRLVAKMLKKNAVHIRNGVDLNRFNTSHNNPEQLKQSLSIPKGAFVIGSVGRLVEQKGYRFLLHAAEKVLRIHPNALFLIIGNGPLHEHLVQLAVQLGINDNVLFAGERSNIEEIYSCFDLFVLSSIWEGMPLSILESMASKVPVIATAIPGSMDIIIDSKNGWLVPPADSEALANAIVHLIESPTVRISLKKEANKSIQSHSIEQTSKEYEKLYLKHLGSSEIR